MSKIAIVTDSSAALPQDWFAQYPIHVVPLQVNWGEETYRDNVDLLPSAFYQRLSQTKMQPTTSQPSVHDFLQVFETLKHQADGIIVPLISSGISGTVNSARLAAAQLSGMPIEVIDTRSTSGGLALAVLAAARAAVQKGNLAEVRHAVEQVLRQLHLFFAVDTLEYLHRGGRIGGAARFFGSALDIRPILHFTAEGKLDALERVRTRSKALQRLAAMVQENTAQNSIRAVFFHANDPAGAEQLRTLTMQQVACSETFTLELSPVIGSHVGPGTVGVAFCLAN